MFIRKIYGPMVEGHCETLNHVVLKVFYPSSLTKSKKWFATICASLKIESCLRQIWATEPFARRINILAQVVFCTVEPGHLLAAIRDDLIPRFMSAQKSLHKLERRVAGDFLSNVNGRTAEVELGDNSALRKSKAIKTMSWTKFL